MPILLIAFALHFHSAHAVKDDAALRTCVDKLATVSILRQATLTEVTGVIRKVTTMHVDFGAFVVPRDRFFLDDLQVAEPGDLISFHHVKNEAGRNSITRRAGVLKSVRDGVIYTPGNSIYASDLVGPLAIIPTGMPVQIVYRRTMALGHPGAEKSRLTKFVGYSGTTIHFEALDLDESELLEAYIPDVVGLYAL